MVEAATALKQKGASRPVSAMTLSSITEQLALFRLKLSATALTMCG